MRLDDALRRTQRDMTAREAAFLVIGSQMAETRSDIAVLRGMYLAAKRTRSRNERVMLAALKSAARSGRELRLAQGRYRAMQGQRAQLAAGMSRNERLSMGMARGISVLEARGAAARRQAMVTLGRSRLVTKSVRKPPSKKNLARFMYWAARFGVSSSDVAAILAARDVLKK